MIFETRGNWTRDRELDLQRRGSVRRRRGDATRRVPLKFGTESSEKWRGWIKFAPRDDRARWRKRDELACRPWESKETRVCVRSRFRSVFARRGASPSVAASRPAKMLARFARPRSFSLSTRSARSCSGLRLRSSLFSRLRSPSCSLSLSLSHSLFLSFSRRRSSSLLSFSPFQTLH